MKDIRPIIFGLLGTIILLSFYFTILTLLNSFNHAISEFVRLWYFMLPLVIGFGVQIGLFFYVRELQIKNISMNGSVVATSGISTTSMVACCAHHISDILPFLGLTGVALFLDKYQYPFILLGIFSSVLGIIFMLNIIKKYHFNDINSKVFKKILSYNLNFGFRVALLLSLIVLFLTIAVGMRI